MNFLKSLLAILLLCCVGVSVAQHNPRNIEASWKTDTTKARLDLNEIFVCIGKDEIPAIDQPMYYSISEAEREYFEFEPLILVEHDMKAKGYPLSVLLYHEIVNDSIVGTDSTLYYSVTYCPLCNSAIVFNLKTKIKSNNKPIIAKNILNGKGNVSLIKLQKNAVLKEHQSITNAMLVLLSGHLIYEEKERIEALSTELDFLYIPEKVTHKFSAKEDTLMMLVQ